MRKRAPNNRSVTISPDEIATLCDFITNPGDDILNTENALINAELRVVVDRLPDGFADLIILDPPYNITKDFNGLTFRATDDARYEEYLGSWLGSVVTKLRPGGTLYLCGDWQCSNAMQRALSKHLTIVNRITWQREKGRGSRRGWKNSMEDIWMAVKSGGEVYFDADAVKMRRRVLAPYRENGHAKDWEQTSQGCFRDTFASNFWDDISVPFWSMPENTPHPTQKPEKLYAKLILASSRPGDMVFDPMAGSCTAAVVASKLGRRYCCVEINREYCLYGAKRLLMAQDDSSIQGYEDGVFWERNSQPRRKIR